MGKGMGRMTGTKRAAIYARFSSDLQRDRSIEDQVELCRTFAARNGYTIAAAYEDRARTGASVLGRDGLMRLLDAARDGAFTAVIVEALDRLSRDQEDLAGLYKRLSFLGVEIIAVHDGKADQVQVGIRGLVGALYLQDLAHKVRRGMAGVIRDGRHAGGRAYGYRPVAGKPGQLEIVGDEAEVIKRIFTQYAAGVPPRSIAAALNREGVPPPRGRYWTAATINGNTKRGNGILQNDLYAGKIVWNRVRMVRDPDTGRRVSRVNPPDAWQRTEAPHLQIIDAETFAAVQARKRAGYAPRERLPAPKRMLSGLLRCGCCGSGMSVKDRSRGRVRIICTLMKEAGTCGNRRSYYLDVIEQAVTDGLRERLGSRQAIAAYIAAYNDEMRKLNASASAARAKLENRRATAQRRLERAIDALINEELPRKEAVARVAALEAERNEADAQLEAAARAPEPIALHPAAVKRYLSTIERLADAAAREQADGNPEVMQAVRDLIESVTVQPTADGGLTLAVEGRLASLIGRDLFPRARVGVGGLVVAEARFFRTPHAVPFAFQVAVA